MERVERLLTELQTARIEALKDVPGTPPELRSAILEVKRLLERLVTQGWSLAADLHEAAHDRSFEVDVRSVDEWQAKSEGLLSDLLVVLESCTE